MHRFWNQTKTAVLLGAMFALVIGAGALITGGRAEGIILAFLLGGGGAVVSYFFSDKIAIKTMRGQQVDEQSAPDLVQMVGRLAQNADVPMPKVYICPQDAPNAFATGRNPSHAAVAVTHGALRLLDYDELEGVIGHELSHVKNHDTLISTVAATIAGALQMLAWLTLFDRRENPLIMLALFILAPIAAGIIQAAISRSREYVADADGARIAGTPNGLISALQKLEATNRRVPTQGAMPSQNHMFIVQPLSGGEMAAKLGRMFATHPSTQDRIAKLRQMA